MKSLVSVGQAYRPTGISATGRSASWVIATVYTGLDGRQYAKLVNAVDGTELKTICADALADNRLFTPIAA
ncbi:MAG TPA: hypothetical protein VKQ29_10010 [Aliidongia sp.]|nr:hypothetical protein [Aliidongia sp.]